MRQAAIQLHSVNDVKKFIHNVNLYDFDIDLISGRYVVDAKSIMGLFSLDLNKPILMEIHSDDSDNCDKLLNAIEEFLIQEA